MRTFTFEENLEKIHELLRHGSNLYMATAFLNTFETKEKENLISALKIKREKNIAHGHYEFSVNYSIFLDIEFTSEEIDTLLKDSINNGYFDSSVERMKKLSIDANMDTENAFFYLLNLSKEMKSFKAIEYFSKKLNLPIEKEILEEVLKKNIEWGRFEEVQKIINLLDRKLKPKEKTELFKNVYYHDLEDALMLEQFCNQKIPNSWFLEKRKKAIEAGNYRLALNLSKITNRKIRNVDLEQILYKLIFNNYLTDKEKKDLESLEKHFPTDYLIAKKELAIKENVENGNLESSLQRVKDIGRNLSIKEFFTILRSRIQSSSREEDIKKVLENMKEFYPEEAKGMEKI